MTGFDVFRLPTHTLFLVDHDSIHEASHRQPLWPTFRPYATGLRAAEKAYTKPRC
jgi:hypothetical protein